MNREELVSAVTKKVKERGYSKRAMPYTHEFAIRDFSGNETIFYAKEKEREIPLTRDDVRAVLFAIIDVVKDALSVGESIVIKNVCSAFLTYRKECAAKKPGTDIWYTIPGKWVPKIKFGPGVVTEVRQRYERKLVRDGGGTSDEDLLYDFDYDNSLNGVDDNVR